MRVDVEAVFHAKPQNNRLLLAGFHLSGTREQFNMRSMRDRRVAKPNLLRLGAHAQHSHAQTDQRGLHMPPDAMAF
jgi:hypothetical protein